MVSWETIGSNIHANVLWHIKVKHCFSQYKPMVVGVQWSLMASLDRHSLDRILIWRILLNSLVVWQYFILLGA